MNKSCIRSHEPQSVPRHTMAHPDTRLCKYIILKSAKSFLESIDNSAFNYAQRRKTRKIIF